MGRNVDDIPWPKRQPKRAKQKKSSGSANGTTVGMAILAFIAMPAGLVVGLALWLAHGYGVI
mgnify:CR=1 FL=1